MNKVLFTIILSSLLLFSCKIQQITKKSKFLEKSVLGNAGNSENISGSQKGAQIPSTPKEPPTPEVPTPEIPTPEIPTPEIPQKALSFDFNFMCSDGQTLNQGTNLQQAKNGVSAYLYKVSDTQSGYQVFSELASFDTKAESVQNKKDLINFKVLNFDISIFPKLENNESFLFQFCDYDMKDDCKASFYGYENLEYMMSTGSISYMHFYNVNTFTVDHSAEKVIYREFSWQFHMPPNKFHILANKANDEGKDDEKCDLYHSPLIIDIKGDGLILTAPLDGIDFDIKGEGLKNRISWVKNNDDMFLTLPKNGEINSVHELFGNNTKGPDGKNADNGFEALRKHDSNRDGFIDNKDKIFRKLRLWSDENKNGKSDFGELLTLSAMRIKSIDLDYISMYEKDIYKNRTLQRSVITQEDSDDLMMIFDIWFRTVSM